MSDYLKKRMEQILNGRPLPENKKKQPIAKKSAKRLAKEKEQSEKGSDRNIDKWFDAQKKKLTQTCQCGCGNKSVSNSGVFYRNLDGETMLKDNSKDISWRGAIAHIFPKRLFPSIAMHDLNWVERSMYGGCHARMDDGSMDKWPNMADWDDIKEKFHSLAPLLTDEERASKFYSKLESLIYVDSNRNTRTSGS